MKKRFFIVLTALVLLVCLAVVLYWQFYRENGEKSENKDNIILSIDLNISAPFSNINTSTNINGRDYKITRTSKSGIIVLKGGASDLTADTKSDYLTANQFKELTDLVNNNFWSLSDNYKDQNIVDGTFYALVIASCGDHVCGETEEPNIKKVSCYAQCPLALEKIINKIEELSSI